MTKWTGAKKMITFLTAFNLLGIFVFGISGAIAGIKHNADIFGVTVLSLVASSTRGSMRDLSIGTIPPQLSDWQNILSGLLLGPMTFYLYPLIKKINHLLLLFDALAFHYSRSSVLFRPWSSTSIH